MEEAVTHLPLLAKCPKIKVSQFVHRVIDGACHLAGPEYDNYSDLWTLEEWWNVNHSLKSLIKCSNSVDDEQLMKWLDGVPSELQTSVVEAIKVRKDNIRRSLVTSTCAISNVQLQDVDWKVKIAMSSDKLGTIQEPLASVDLSITKDCGPDLVTVECNKQELHMILTSLEAANRALQSVS